MVLISPDSERTMQTYLGITAELSTEQIDLAPPLSAFIPGVSLDPSLLFL